MNDFRFVIAAYAVSIGVVGTYAWHLARRLRRARDEQRARDHR